MYTGTRPGVPPPSGWEGVAGTPGACSQVFCHPIRCIVMVHRQRFSIYTRSAPPPPPPPTTSHHHHHDCPRVANISVVTQFLSSPTVVVECHGERVSGAAKRCRKRRLRQWHRHERLTVQMALCEALHHAAPQVERGENSARRG